MVLIAPVVEGHGDCDAIPVLVRRVAESLFPPVYPRVESPLRVPRNRLIKPGELERAVEYSARRVGQEGRVLIVIDADDDCPATLGPELLRRATQARGDVRTGVVIAKREYEAWFLTGAESLRGKRGLSDELTPPPNPESMRGPKEWLTRHKRDGSAYVETLDQAALTACLDLDLTRRSDSFDKCYRELTRLLL